MQSCAFRCRHTTRCASKAESSSWKSAVYHASCTTLPDCLDCWRAVSDARERTCIQEVTLDASRNGAWLTCGEACLFVATTIAWKEQDWQAAACRHTPVCRERGLQPTGHAPALTSALRDVLLSVRHQAVVTSCKDLMIAGPHVSEEAPALSRCRQRRSPAAITAERAMALHHEPCCSLSCHMASGPSGDAAVSPDNQVAGTLHQVVAVQDSV